MNSVRSHISKMIWPVVRLSLILVLGAACQPAPAATEPAAGGIPVSDCDTLLPPSACVPEWEQSINYTSLTDLPSTECSERLLDPQTGRCAVFTYTNNDQDFTIQVEGADADVLSQYVSDAAVYFEVRRAGKSQPEAVELPSLAQILVNSAVEVTGLAQQDLTALHMQLYEKNEAITAVEFLFEITGDDSTGGKVADTAVRQAQAAYDAVQADRSSVPGEIEALMNEPGAPVFSVPGDLPSDEAAYQFALANDPASLLVTMEWVDVPKEQAEDQYAVWYAFDPWISADPAAPWHQTPVGINAAIGYKEKCNALSSSAQIQATQGSMTLSFWRETPYHWVGSKTANVQTNPKPPAMAHTSSPSRGKYDAKVKGGPAGGKYYIYGGWVQGSGCQ